MAEFKTAEQYVVEKVETLERELDNVNIEHKAEMAKTLKELAELKVELNGAYELLNMLRDFVNVRSDNYFGNIVSFDNIYGRGNAELVARIMEYYDIRPDEEGDNE